MKPEKPEWYIEDYHKQGRAGVQLIEFPYNWHLKQTDRRGIRIIKTWSLRRNSPFKRYKQARDDAFAMKMKLEHTWPCTFLVKGYPYKAPKTYDT